KNQDIGSASKLWLHHSLNSLNSSRDNKLNFYSDNPLEIIKKIIKENNITYFYWNRCYDKYRIDRDTQIKQFLQQHKINVNSFN
ncbi:deoxyribodipyrimidine photo-lyase, partial [Francisella tularensis]|uniref:deoxyribodipyrimidine photo-lyase n=1 Tax=Francisella tularensis TaxID=263 RepID=UPI002381B63C